MFRIESYITPIILSHIDKYVKDFRPRDAQVSLWGGEVVFQNLDVRLDVLEEELQLPFNFVSGHIHELTVKVPWTKIASEPIQITINTIEFVLKLKNDSNVSAPKRKKSTKTDVDQPLPGYMASLVNKIANNISLKLHNIILKYVEEDIVVSMNIQLLSFDSADDDWKPAFIDISPTKVFLKKVISITDLTICLDKRNAMGKIDVCQEPILYRCSLQIRMLRKYNLSSLHKSSLTRIDVFTDNIELNISAQQYPMFIRLLVLGMTLKEGTPNVHQMDTATDDEYGDEENGESMLLWAWNMLPSIFPVENEDDEDEQKGHYLHAGLYVTNFSITIKSQEYTTDNIVQSTKKIKYHPILRISVSGIYADVVTLGNRWFSMKGGISFIGVYPLGMCTCGKKHNITAIHTSADVPFDHKLFLNDSLQDPNSLENKGENRNYDFSWESYYAEPLNDSAMGKTPALSFDVVHYIDVPDDMSRSSILGSDLEYSNLSESFCVRCVVGPFNFKYCSSFIHIMDALKEYLDSYDYVPYGDDKCAITLNQLSPPLTEDYDALMSDIPLKVFQLKIMQPAIELIVEREESKIKIKNDNYLMPLLTLECQEISAKCTQPYYPQRLVHTACQLPAPAEKLLDHSYTKWNCDAKKLSANIVCGLAKHNVLHVPSANITLNQLIKPEFWQKITLPTIQCNVNVDKMMVKCNKPQMILLRYLVNSLSTGNLNSFLFESSILMDMHRKDLVILDLYFGRIYAAVTTFEHTIGITGSMQSFYGYTYTMKVMESMPEDQRFLAKSMVLCTGNDSIDVVKFICQLPTNATNLLHPPMVKLCFHVIDFNIDPVLLEFFDYQAEYLQRQETKAPKSPKRSFTSEKHPQVSRKSVNRPESVHSSSEPTATMTLVYRPKSVKQAPNTSIDLMSLINIFRCSILQIELKELSLVVPNKPLKLLHPNSSLSSLQKKNPQINHIVFKLPTVVVKSSHVRNNTVDFEQKFPIIIPDAVWNHDKDGFPWICSLADLTCYTIQNDSKFDLLTPFKSTISIALTRKRKDENESVYDHSFAIHIDTQPIEFNFYEEQIAFLMSSIGVVNKVMTTTFCIDERTELPALEICERSNTTNYHSDLKEFFGTTKTKSENSSDDTVQVEEETLQSKLTTWIQWTLAKISLNFHSRKGDQCHKFSIELEDIITSIDNQDIYVKVKTKVGFLTGTCKTKSTTKDEWDRNDLLGLTTISEGLRDNLDTFLEMTFTKAMISNVHTKWQTKKKENLNLNDSITEINVTMQRIDMKLDIEMLTTFMPIVGHLVSNKPTESMPTNVISVTDIPLVYFNSKGMQIFVPLKASDQCNVLILKIDSVSVNPTVENPLIRKPVRCDIYSKAAQLRILNMPGSKVEDRQYEIVFNKISVGSGKWDEILRFMNPSESDSMYYENPAFDWNHKTEKPSIEVNAIFSNFNLAVQYAPCIVFKNVLVCGESIEVNCLSDLMVDLTTEELQLFHTLQGNLMQLQESIPKMRESSNVNKLTLSRRASNKNEPLPKAFLKNEYNAPGTKNLDNHLTDSGFESFERYSGLKYKRIKSRASVIKTESKFVPFEVSFVGGKFNLNVFQVKKCETSVDAHRYPLFSITLFQPNMLIAQSSLDKTIQLSLFDLSFKLGSNDSDAQDKFNITVFDTHKGNLNVLGIPPSLILYKEYTTPSGDKNLDIHIDRPMRLYLSPAILDQLLSVNLLLRVYVGQGEFQPGNVISSSTTIQNIKNGLRDASRFNFSIAETDLDCTVLNEFSLKLYLAKMAVKLNVFDYPKRLTLDGYVNSLVVSMDRFVIVNPLSVNVICVLTQEQWKKAPLVVCKISSPCIDVNIAPQNIVQTLKARNSFVACLEKYVAKTQLRPSTLTAHPLIDYSNLVPIKIPRHIPSSNLSSEEHYQDDLRAGAFQFIDSNSDETLPQPYQIQIISKAGGIICWRYPQPRTLHYMQIFPIPIFNPANDCIKCRLEYYSEPHTAFIVYCEFVLSEKEVQELKLPNVRVSSEIWRIVVFQPFVSIDGQYFQEENSSEDEESDENQLILEKSLKSVSEPFTTHGIDDYLNRDTDSNIFHLNPRALVGCIRIDSIFSSVLVPNIQLVTDVSHCSLTIKNNLNLSDGSMKSVLGQFTAVGDASDTHTVIKFNATKLNSHFCLFYDNNITLQTSFVFSTNVIDYSYLVMQPLIEDVNIQLYYENTDNVNIHVVTDELRIRYGTSVGHSLAVTEQIWRQMLTNTIPHTIFVMRYIICNCTSVPLHFGQHLTEESIYLKPNECCLYAFRTDKLEQKIAFSFGENKWCPSDPMCVGKDDVQFLKMDEDRILITKTKKISASQKRIVVRGQIELLNMSEQSFIVQYKNARNKEDAVEFSLDGKTSTSIVQPSNPEKDFCMNLRLFDKHGRGWSGDIPLHKTSKNIPWLVKVPTTTSQHHYSFWVRVQCEPISNQNSKNVQNQRIFITIWPLFVCRSMMISSTTIVDKNSTIDYNLAGYGQSVELPMAAEYETEHELKFNSKFPFTLSYKTIDPNSFFTIPEKLQSILATSTELEKTIDVNWPCSREEELRWMRRLSGVEHPPPIFKCSPSRKLSCSILVDLLPGCLFINSIGCDINLVNSANNQTCLIESNNIAVPFELLNSFTITFMFPNDVTSSCHINLSGSNCRKNSYYDLPDVGSVVLQLLTENGVSKFVLTSLNENGTRVFILSPFFVVCNLSGEQFDYWAFCVSSKDKHSMSVYNTKAKVHAVPCNSKISSSNTKGIGILEFCNLSHQRNHLFNYFLAIRCNTSEFSMPFLLNKTVSRIGFCVNNGKRFVPLSMCITEHQGQHFICIQDDTAPTIEFENRTELNLLLAQCDLNDSIMSPVEHIKDIHFEWLQTVPSNATVFYTPPSINEHFPEKSDSEIAIILAAATTNAKWKWSAPIRIYESNEFFLDLPSHGDVKVITDCRRKVVKIIIENINYKMEFNVKDIRTKILHPSERVTNSMDQANGDDSILGESVKASIPNTDDALVSSNQRNVESTCVKIDLFVKGFSIFLYTDNEDNNLMKTELIALYLDDITFFYTDKDRKMELDIRNFQIDNRLFSSGNFDFPVVLCAQNPPTKLTASPSIFSIDELKSDDTSKSACNLKVLFFCDDNSPEEIYCNFQPIRAYVEDKYINVLLDFLVESHPSNLIYKQDLTVQREFCDRGEILIPKLVVLQSTALSEPLRIRHVRIEPLSVLLSVHTCIRMYIALDHSPLDFAPFERNEIFTLPVRFGYNLGMHYVSGAIFGAGWVVGSLEILGSPGGLARSVSTGLRDFVSMPVQGLLRGPWGFFVGITHGSASLLRNITAGTVNSVTKLAASVARNLDRLSLDDEHLQRTEALRRSRPQGITHGFAQGLTGLGISLLGAVGGLARHTLEATSSVGVVTGLGRGIVGAVTKPISGAAELVALTGQGMLHTVGFNQMPIARAVDVQKLDSDEPSPEKIVGKLLPRLINTDQVLFLSFAALETIYGLKSVYVALTTSLVVLISLEKDEVVEIVSMERAYPLIDENDRTLINLNVTSENLDESTELKGFQYGRVLQYIQDSTEDFVTLTPTEFSKINFGVPKADHKISFFMDQHLAQHLVNYIRLLQNCKRKK
ncbi:vacuolar protein sorting-associated protein 13B isoform X2 [Bradysia coprophila]|uniref:vacuolar protein sorting-associated protein 13B isoform X2 n=1 Tax=Bradysia coprophila TaxID=38358 RepID=UPI00187D875E|nr:vacuolar protein sorting-associated protein 13B isoform X2 [Bradysia coprophila]